MEISNQNEDEQRHKKRGDKKLLVLFSVVLMLATALSTYMALFHPMIFLGHHATAEYKEHFDPQQAVVCVLFGDKNKVGIDGKVNTKKKGTYPVTYYYGRQKTTIKVDVKDTKAPALDLLSIPIDAKSDLEPSVFVRSLKDADSTSLKVTKSNDKKEPGNYEATIQAIDASGNKTSKTIAYERRTDTVAPTVESVKALEIHVGKPYDWKEGIQVKDNLDPKPIIEVDEKAAGFDETKAGVYEVPYHIKDHSGNTTTIKRVVHVRNSDEQDPNSKIVYLTFDDGPSANTAKVLDILKKYQVQATFFVTGLGPDYNEYITRAHKEGHTVGLHTFTHDYSIYQSEATFYDDLNKISKLVESLTGEKSHFVRFPGGSSNTVSRQYNIGIMSRLTNSIKAKGYKYYDWNCSSTDAAGGVVPANQIVKNATSATANKINILFHDSGSKTTTVEALPKIIEYYQAKGYEFKGISDESFEPHHGVNN